MSEKQMAADLIERLERATGPDRELDCLIAAEFGILDDFNPAIFIVPPIYRVSADGRRVEAYTQINSEEPWLQASREPLPYTASIDAAVTLVPEGLAWFVERIDGFTDGDARLWIPSQRTKGQTKENFDVRKAATPAIALTLAAIKARQATGGDRG